MDLNALLNHDSSVPPSRYKSQSQSPAQAPRPPPQEPPRSAPDPAKLERAEREEREERKRKKRIKPIWAEEWTPQWKQRHGVQAAPSAPSQTNGFHEDNTPSPPRPPQPSKTPERRQKSWEANIAARAPLDQISKTVADFLFINCINQADLVGAKWEVEAKLGSLVDQMTNDRMRLPVQNDCILDKSDPSVRVAFHSTMTEAQHKAFNEFLNGALMASLPPKPGAPLPPKARIPLSYKHTRQVDTFYDLTPNAVSRIHPGALGLIGNVNRARVRVTTDQKDGRELAKIIKVRLADLDVYSPNTLFDWRISINAEIEYTGPVEELVLSAERGVPTPPRNKDRLTYRHQLYQIDLTQVTGVDKGKEHELEVEIEGMEELRSHGKRLLEGRDSSYEQMVRGFVDNVRLLQRTLPTGHP